MSMLIATNPDSFDHYLSKFLALCLLRKWRSSLFEFPHYCTTRHLWPSPHGLIVFPFVPALQLAQSLDPYFLTRFLLCYPYRQWRTSLEWVRILFRCAWNQKSLPEEGKLAKLVPRRWLWHRRHEFGILIFTRLLVSRTVWWPFRQRLPLPNATRIPREQIGLNLRRSRPLICRCISIIRIALSKS